MIKYEKRIKMIQITGWHRVSLSAISQGVNALDHEAYSTIEF